MRTIPPLNPLHVFEVAARTGSFTKAAGELRVTQSAVSRQIATLEDYIGTKLFQRENKGIVLTRDGRDFYAEIGPAFSRISTATDSLVSKYKSNSLRVAGYPTFAVKWLIPRLSRYKAANRTIQVRLQTSILPVNFDFSPFDVAIQLRAPDEMDQEYSRLLFWDVIQPYCSPLLLAQCNIKTIEDLLKARRLSSHYRRSDWRDWLFGVGHSDIAGDGDEFPSSLLTYEAAAEGLGVVIGQNYLLTDDVKSGILVPLFSPVRRKLAYYIIWNKNTNYKVRNFVRWIREEIERDMQPKLA